MKGVTAIILDPENQPAIERRKGDCSLMHMNSWINPDGWQTDSYIPALTYPDKAALAKKRPSRKAVIYGSTLRDSTAARPHLSTLEKTDKVW